MRIAGIKLTKLAAAKGVTVAQLAQAVERDGLKGERAASAVRNWMIGRDHPRCRHEDIKKLADTLQADVAKIAKFTAVLMHHRGSPRKAKLLTDLIKGKDILVAENLLAFNTKRAAVNVRKALKAAINDAEQVNADTMSLVVTESRVDDGPRLKRFKEKDRGRAHRILKRLAHITIALEDKN